MYNLLYWCKIHESFIKVGFCLFACLVACLIVLLVGWLVWGKVLMYSPGLTSAHYVAQAGLKVSFLLPHPSQC